MADNENTRAPAAAPLPLTDAMVLGRWRTIEREVAPDQYTLADVVLAFHRAIERECRGTPAAGEPTVPTAERIMATLERFGREDSLRFRVPGTSRSEKVRCRVYALEELGELVRAILAASGHQASPSEPQAGQEVSVSDARGKA